MVTAQELNAQSVLHKHLGFVRMNQVVLTTGLIGVVLTAPLQHALYVIHKTFTIVTTRKLANPLEGSGVFPQLQTMVGVRQVVLFVLTLHHGTVIRNKSAKEQAQNGALLLLVQLQPLQVQVPLLSVQIPAQLVLLKPLGIVLTKTPVS